MHVMQISFFVDPQRRSPERLLHDWHSLERRRGSGRDRQARA